MWLPASGLSLIHILYGRVDVLLREEDGAPFVLEINPIPGMTPSSLLPKAAAASGWPYEDPVSYTHLAYPPKIQQDE